jgi:gas vesicle protein
MKLQDVKNLEKNDVLALLGLQTKESGTSRLLGTLGAFAVGLLAGAGVALLLAPKPGRELRQDIRSKLRRSEEEINGLGVKSVEAGPDASRA